MRHINIQEDGKVNDIVPRSHHVSGTSLQGYVDVSYARLVEVFGEPNDVGDQYKIDVEWCIHTIDGDATIYNWKDSRNYLGEDGMDVEDIMDWHIGGMNKGVVHWVRKALGMVI